MPVLFSRRPIEENVWTPEVCGIDFSSRVNDHLCDLRDRGSELWIAMAEVQDDDLGAGYTEQITQDNCLIQLSFVDDDSDSVAYLDRRDGQWFRFTRAGLPEDKFKGILDMVAPWATKMLTPVPNEAAYRAFLKLATRDLPDLNPEDFNP